MLSDLHMHSFNSDGSATYDELINRAKELKLDAIALTDHDTFAGVNDFLDACKKNNLKAISGIELSTYINTEIHILGYNINPNAQTPIKQELKNLEAARTHRMELILEKLREFKINISLHEIVDTFNTHSISRTHIAILMAKKGYVKSKKEAFELYLNSNRPAFVNFYHFSPFSAIEIIRQSGGVPVLAHPGRLKIDETEIQNLIKKAVNAGLMGIETYYPAHSKNIITLCKKLSDKYNLINTNGSDTHNIDDGLVTDFETEQKTIEVLGL
ncbi:MAG TPA: PHP domain-containing protein [Clostridia bacterium]